MPESIIEGLAEVVSDGVSDALSSNNPKTQGCGCLVIFLVLFGIIGLIIYAFLFRQEVDVIVLDKKANNQVEYMGVLSKEKGTHELDSKDYDLTKVNDTIQIKMIK